MHTHTTHANLRNWAPLHKQNLATAIAKDTATDPADTPHVAGQLYGQALQPKKTSTDNGQYEHEINTLRCAY